MLTASVSEASFTSADRAGSGSTTLARAWWLSVSDGKYVAIQDHDLGTGDRWGVEHTPFQMLLRKDVDLFRDARFFEVQDSEETIAITLEDKSPDSSGPIKLVLSKKPTVELREWVARDQQGLENTDCSGDVLKADDLDPGFSTLRP